MKPEPSTTGAERVASEEGAPDSSPRYSAFTRYEKWCIVALASYAAWFSTVSSFIYFPAIHLLAESLHVTVDKINLTVTSYMAIATIAPTLVGDAADQVGRRPVYVVILSLYVISNIGMAAAQSYAALVGLRVLQALSISGAFSLAYGAVTDIASPAERGSYASAVSFAITIAPSFGPLLSGGLSYAAGWTWIFWFLAIAAGVCLSLITLFLPETSRKIVDDGSIPPPPLLRLPVPKIFCHWEISKEKPEHRLKLRIPNPLRSLKILFRRDNFVIIFACGLLYLVYTCINVSLSVIFIELYGLNQWQAGLIYLPFGLGGVTSTFVSGRLMDGAYRRARTKRGLSTDNAKGDDLDNFPIEKARLSVIWIPLAATTSSVVAYGWTLHLKLHIAVPLTLQFVAGVCMQLDFSIYNTLLVDKNHRAPATAQASSNIMRGSQSAIMVSFLEKFIMKAGVGWFFTFMSGLCIVIGGLFLIDYSKGFRWRQQSRQREVANTVTNE